MELVRYYEKELRDYDSKGYKIIRCSSVEEALDIKETLKLNKKCAQAGKYVRSNGSVDYFVLTKERAK